MTYQIKTLNKIAGVGLERFTSNYSIVEEGDVDGIVLRSFKMHDYKMNTNLKAIARAGAGTNNVPVEACTEKGIVVFNTPGANANGVKEAVIAGLMLASRDIAGAIEWAKTLEGEGDGVPKLVEGGKANFAGPEIKGKTIGVIGLGAIGVLVANACSALGMKVLGYDPYISVKSAWSLSRSVTQATTIEEVYAKADYVTVHVPLMESTKGLIGEASIAQMEDGVRILNFSRAGLIDDTAMAKALASGKVSRYVTDFPNAAVLKMANVIAIPHLGASTPESEVNCACMAVDQMMEYLENGNIINSVNFPTTDMGKAKPGKRMTVFHKNIPNMIGQIAALLAAKDINVTDMINKSKGDWAYTMLDTECKVTKDLVEAVYAIEGVVKVRNI